MQEAFLVQPEEIVVHYPLADRCVGLFKNLRLEVSDVVKPHRGLHHENAAVPVIRAGLQVSGRRFLDRFFSESVQLVDGDIIDPFNFITTLDITITGLGPGRGDPEGHQVVSNGILIGHVDGPVQALDIGEMMIGRHHDDHRIGFTLVQQQ